MKTPILLSALFVTFVALCARAANTNQPTAELLLREVRYEAQLADDDARFRVELDLESLGRGESALELFTGDVAVLPRPLPASLKIVREGNRYLLTSNRAGRFKVTLELVAKIQRSEPWNQVSFTGPEAAIVSLVAQAEGAGMEVQLLSGTLVESLQTNGLARVRGFPGADRVVALRWQGKMAEVARKGLLTVDTTVAAQFTPSVVKQTTQLRYEILQGNAARLTLALPVAQSLTRLAGEQIRDWQLQPNGDRQLLTIEFIKPIEKAYHLTLFTEQPLEELPASGSVIAIDPPQPLEIEREAGLITLAAEDVVMEAEAVSGLRQVNAGEGAMLAYRFHARPFTLALRLKRVEPVLNVADRVSARLEETRLLISHQLMLNVEKAGIYALEAALPPGLAVAEVRGEGIEDWKAAEGRLRVSFAARLSGARQVDVQLEQPLKSFPEEITIRPLRVLGAAKETAYVGAAAAPGLRLRTGDSAQLREIPVRSLPPRSGAASSTSAPEHLAYLAEQPNWQLSLGCERLAARLIADVFNVVTIGDGLVGGSATIRYGIVNQGVQEFRVKLPPHCKNVDFTGPNIRRKELAGDVWTIGLQDKVWGGYTLVVTYDHQFDPQGATLPVGGIHAVDAERETGSIAITSAASLKLTAGTAAEPLRRVDETELAAADRAMITRAVVLAYQYTGNEYALTVEVKRFAALSVLEAVADRTQITSVLTEVGEMLTQASFMVKNNAKQFQRFQLPSGADFWGCYVNGQPAKPERDGDWVLVPLPREANRDQAFAVDIVYAQKTSVANSRWPQTVQLTAPRTDVPNTYAEWQLFAPVSRRLSDFGGSMSVAQGTTYGALDAWRKFLAFYYQVLREAGGAILVIGALALLVVGLVISAARRGVNGVLTLLAVMLILGVLAAMLLPALGKAKARAQRISSVNNLKQIGLAVRLFAQDNEDRMPASFEEMIAELNTDKVTYDPETGQRYTYLGAGLNFDALTPDSIIAYSPIVNGQCNVLMADGSVQIISATRFAEYSQRGLIQVAAAAEVMARKQAGAVRRAQAAPLATVAVSTRAPTTEPAEAPAFGTLVGEGSGVVSGAAGIVPGALPPATAAMAKGVRSLRIEIPREGNEIVFTKVLNVRDEPLSIRLRMMSLATYQSLLMVGQVVAFLLGLAVWLWQWRSARRNSFLLTCALALIVGSVTSLLIAWRALHDALIIGFPVVVVAAIAWWVWKATARRRPPIEERAPDLPPALAAIALAMTLGLTSAQATQTAPTSPAVSIVSAHYTGTINDRVAQLDVTLRLAVAEAGQTLPLFAEDVAVREFRVRGGDARLVRAGNRVAVRLDRRGETTLQIALVTKIGGDVSQRRLAFAIPEALSSQFTLTLDQPEADVDLPTAISFQRIAQADKTRVEAILGSGQRLELLWTPRVKRAAEVAATVFCQNTALATLGGGVVNVRSVLDYQITQGELRQARVRLPAGHRLLRVEAASLRTWEIKEENGHALLVVDLLKGLSPAWQLTLETEAMLEALPARVPLAVPHALDVQREHGMVALRGAEELSLTIETVADLQRVDAEEFARASGEKADGLVSGFRFLKPDFTLQARVETVQPQIEAVVRNHARVGTEAIHLSAAIEYLVKRAGVFRLRVGLPEGYRVERVTGQQISQWTEREAAGRRVLEVALKERTSGNCALQLELTRSLRELPSSLAIVGVQPLDTAKLTGYVSALAEPGVALKSEAFDGLLEIPAVALPDAAALTGAGGVLAFKFLTTDAGDRPAWKLTVATETVAPWLRAEVVNTFALTETLVSGRAAVRFDIANAPVKELRLRVPVALKNVEIAGMNIRQREARGEIWRIDLQGQTRGVYTLTVTWEQPRAAETNRLELIGISAEGVERETGLLAVTARPPLQVDESAARDLQRVDPREFPEWAGRPDAATVLAYRYVRPGYQLAVSARRFAEAEVLQALVDHARLTTVVADDGQTMTEMALAVRNNGRQFLEVELPVGATVWSAFVAGQPVRPSQREGRLLLPLQEWGAAEDTIAVELTYVGTNVFPRLRGDLQFISPKLDVPLKNARWELYLPPDYDYARFGGTMAREVAARPSLLNFGLSEYLRMEKQSQAAYQEEAKKDVTKAQSNLSVGNVRGAVADYNRARLNYYTARDEGGAVQKLEQQLRTAQADNLIQAQQAFVISNTGLPADSPLPAAGGRALAEYDNAAAQAQWMKLAKAQEVTAATLQPLHVNLPLRGLRYAFGQVLQTEINKPMTIQLQATNTRTGNWLGRAGIGVAGFLALWAVVALATRRSRQQPAST